MGKKMRGFEIVSKYNSADVTMPKRTTLNAAGYDFASAENFIIPSHYKPVLIPTGIKAYMQPNEVLLLFSRSSNPLKRHLVVPNGVGVIDADYYNNADNEGEIFIQLSNTGEDDYLVQKGDRLAQGIFVPYLLTDDDAQDGQKRIGGWGSTGN